jgi:hypothetical protein
MSQILNLELSEKVFAAIQLQAHTTGVSPEQLAANLIEKQFAPFFESFIDEVEKNVARERFERHFGSLELEDGIGLDNESIDADLRREYTSTHEEE